VTHVFSRASYLKLVKYFNRKRLPRIFIDGITEHESLTLPLERPTQKIVHLVCMVLFLLQTFLRSLHP